MKLLLDPFRVGLALAACCLAGAEPTHAQEPHPLVPVAEAVTVRGYPVADGPAASFDAQRRAAVVRAVADAIAERGEPLVREGGPAGVVRMLYPDTLVVVSSYHSNAIVCRVDIAATRLREEVRLDPLLSLSAHACRNSEVRGWAGRVEPLEIVPIGSEPLAGSPGVTVRLYLTDQLRAVGPAHPQRSARTPHSSASRPRSRPRRGAGAPRPSRMALRMVWRRDDARTPQRLRPT